MAQYVMVLRRARSITRGIGRGWDLEIDTILGPENGNERSGAIWAQKIRKIRISGAESGSVSVVFSVSYREMSILRGKSQR